MIFGLHLLAEDLKSVMASIDSFAFFRFFYALNCVNSKFWMSFSLFTIHLLIFAALNSTMLIQVVKSKIHRVRVTQAELNYIGSITIDERLMQASNIIEGERVQIVNINNGERLETYVIKGDYNSGTICLNGPAARRVSVNDKIIIIGYGFMDFEEAKSFKPCLVFPDEETNSID